MQFCQQLLCVGHENAAGTAPWTQYCTLQNLFWRVEFGFVLTVSIYATFWFLLGENSIQLQVSGKSVANLVSQRYNVASHELYLGQIFAAGLSQSSLSRITFPGPSVRFRFVKRLTIDRWFWKHLPSALSRTDSGRQGDCQYRLEDEQLHRAIGEDCICLPPSQTSFSFIPAFSLLPTFCPYIYSGCYSDYPLSTTERSCDSAAHRPRPTVPSEYRGIPWTLQTSWRTHG